MKLSGSVSGAQAVSDALLQISKESQRSFAEAITESALLIHETAIQSIQAHQSAGRTYKRGSVSHTASQPGYPPNTDTGTLVKSIGFNISEAELSADVGTNLKYGAYLEFGTTSIRARPWLLPAVRSVQDRIKEMFRSIKFTISSKGAA